MIEQLKPCPFCGASEAETIVDDGAHWTRCTRCGSTGPLGSKYSEDADTDWNTRALLAQRCACPSGDGSLRWPCPVCPPEPVAWRGINEYGEVVTEWIDGSPPERMTDLHGNQAGFASIQHAYANLPAQAPVVLPERADAMIGSHDHQSGWNACLGEFKRLNPGITEAAQLRKS